MDEVHETPDERARREEKEAFKEKLKGVSFNHKFMNKRPTVNRKVMSEDTGKLAGYHTQHWDGRQDATVLPETKEIKMGIQQ